MSDLKFGEIRDFRLSRVRLSVTDVHDIKNKLYIS